MNKKQTAEYLNTLAIQLQARNQILTIEEAQSLIGMTIKRMADQIVKTATPTAITHKGK